VVPALAVADALRAEGAGVAFVGGERAERELVPAAGYELETIAVEGLSRTNPLRAARALGKAAAAIVQERGIEQLSDTAALESLADQVIAANPKPAADFRAGNAASLNFLKGQLMKLSRGQANPQVAGEILERKLQ